MLANVLRLEGAVEANVYDVSDEVGLFFFDVAAAFPSVAHEWMWRVLWAMRFCPTLCGACNASTLGLQCASLGGMGFRFSSPCALWRPTEVSYVRHALGARL